MYLNFLYVRYYRLSIKKIPRKIFFKRFTIYLKNIDIDENSSS